MTVYVKNDNFRARLRRAIDDISSGEFTANAVRDGYITICVHFDRNCYDEHEDYKPDEWNCFPNVLPPKDGGEYLVGIVECRATDGYPEMHKQILQWDARWRKFAHPDWCSDGTQDFDISELGIRSTTRTVLFKEVP